MGRAHEGGALLRYVVYRLLWLVPTLLAMALVTFLVMHATPGQPPRSRRRGRQSRSRRRRRRTSPRTTGSTSRSGSSSRIFVGKAVRGDFGQSFVYKTRTVREILVETFPISLFLGSMALVLAVTGGVTLGVLAAVYQNRVWDYVSVSVATLGVSVPNFVLAVFLIVLFSFDPAALPHRRLELAAPLGAAHRHARARAPRASSRASRARACSRSSAPTTS